jgi:serine/threonine protein kinase/tetratricopeptide (TPR) repeat protein
MGHRPRLAAARTHAGADGVTPERWQRVKELFELASSVEPEQQRDYLSSACGDDRELFGEVASLLAMNTVDDAIVDKPAAAYVNAEALGEPSERMIGKRIGPYEIVSLLGHGGMGAVYRARRADTEFDKEVAIKLVPGGYQAQFVLQRLRSERQILATLDHPGIARLIDGGATQDGAPYLVMELVEGEPIDRYCDSRNLSQRERLALFRQVCAAVTYAHQHLVVHRDLKPGNILVTADGKVKLLDFGIAKLLQPLDADATAAPTVTQMRALTPGYSSPEQILGRPITTASDVYSLGVLLYLLLTGRSPYRGVLASTQDAIREVVETEPTRPDLVHDLEAITLRALRKEPERRYSTVQQFSEDIRRYLEGLPVVAHGDQFSYRAGKFLRRHRISIAAASLVVIALITASVISIRQAQIAERERARAERHFASVRKLADVFMFQMHDAIQDLQGATEARALLVKTALEYLNTLSEEAGGDPGLQLDLANAYKKVADIQGGFASANIGESRAAIDSYSHAIQLLEPLKAHDSLDFKVRLTLSRSYSERAQLELVLGDAAAARASAQSSVAVAEGLVKGDASRESRTELANAYQTRALIFGQTGDYSVSVPSVEAGTRISEELLREDPDDIETMLGLSQAYSLQSQSIMAADPGAAGLERGIAYSRKALEIDQRVVKATGGNNARHLRSLMADYINLCNVLHTAGRFAEAVNYCRDGAPLSAKLSADKNNIQSQIDGGTFRWNLGNVLLDAGAYAEAEATFKANVEALQQIEKSSNTLIVQYTLAASEQGLGTIESRAAQRKALPRGDQIKHWKAAAAWYERAIPRFIEVQKTATLDASDIKPAHDATKGLARARDALAALR